MPKLNVKSSRKVYRIADKWAKTNVMLQDKGLRSFIPVTRRFNQSTFRSMLQRYRMVYVKPTFGSLGRGVMRVEKRAGGTYSYQLGGRRRSFKSFDALYRAVKQDTLGKSYLVQQGIHALGYEGRSYDLRVVVQQSPSGGLEATGTVARVAHPGKIVTNGSQGGTILPAEQVLGISTSPLQRVKLLRTIDQIGVNTMKRLRRRYPRLKEIGLDVAIDRNHHPWILEVNTTPDHCPFAILQDQTMIRKIIDYGSRYGRRYRLKCFKAKTTL
ncbi:YheC/YheD family protein [Paenibacillus nanensis]|uniref:YheC/YheD family protein n=1 Tax=Paenibacillus nanensis TaxID=393251 RepID=A0A3A1VI84_9BACL|nr:YheC/YheD family protein [Paenibacillus nanensis]RIX60207.1 YheC/YheD family protein [Paenibacillus nanensis]